MEVTWKCLLVCSLVLLSIATMHVTASSSLKRRVCYFANWG